MCLCMQADTPSAPFMDRQMAWQNGASDFAEEDVAALAGWWRRGALSQVLPVPVRQFEKRLADLTGAEHGVAFCNGTMALQAALWAVGVRAGDEVLIPAYSFHGMAAAALALGARIVPCDIESSSLCMDPLDILRAASPATKALLVHNPWGVPAHWRELRRLAAERGLALVSDASHAHGAVCEGEPLGRWADITCYSFGLNKLISGGELGGAVTNSAEFRDRMLLLAHPNRVPRDLLCLRWSGNALGLKARPHPFAAALALPQFDRFPAKLEKLRATCRKIEELFEPLGFQPQKTFWPTERVYWRLVLRIDDAHWSAVATKELEGAFRQSGFPVEPNPYWPLLQEQTLFAWPEHQKSLRLRDCPQARKVVPRLITLPAPVLLPAPIIERAFAELRERLPLLPNEPAS